MKKLAVFYFLIFAFLVTKDGISLYLKSGSMDYSIEIKADFEESEQEENENLFNSNEIDPFIQPNGLKTSYLKYLKTAKNNFLILEVI